ncbi:hypothetical protein D3C73_1081920 [compost metagenome]
MLQVLRKALGRTVPASGDTDSALPETRATQVIAGVTDGLADGAVEQHFYAARGRHAHGLPSLIGEGDARLVQCNGDQLLAVLFIPGCHQPMAQDRRPRTPSLATVQ